MHIILVLSVLLAATESPQVSDVERWNEGVRAYRAGDVSNAVDRLGAFVPPKITADLALKPYAARAAGPVAKLRHELGDAAGAAQAAQVALWLDPADKTAQNNFAVAAKGLRDAREAREQERLTKLIQQAEGKDPGALLKQATDEARRLFTDAGTYRTNAAPKAVALADAYEVRALKLADAWVPLRQVIAQSVTNEEQAATILAQLDQAAAATKKAATELGNLDGGAYGSMSQVEHDFTRFLKLTVLPPQAMDEDLVAQSNAWQDVEAFNTRPWQPEALDYTRAFRAKFPMWARAYEQQAQADTNKPPFTAEAQAKVSALATELEKIQIECCEKNLPPQQEKAIEIINEIRELLPKDNQGQGQGEGQGEGQGQDQKPQSQEQDQQQDQQQQDEQQDQQQNQEENPEQEKPEDTPVAEDSDGTEKDDPELEAILKKAQERNDEHEAEKKARMRKAPLPPNERDW